MRGEAAYAKSAYAAPGRGDVRLTVPSPLTRLTSRPPFVPSEVEGRWRKPSPKSQFRRYIRQLQALLTILILFLLPLTPAQAQSPDLTNRADDILAVLKDQKPLDQVFSPAFLTAVPPEKMAAIRQSLATQYGAPRTVTAIDPTSSIGAMLHIRYAGALVDISLAIDPAPPHQVTALRIENVRRIDDSLEAVTAAIRALPGQTAFAITPLDSTNPALASIQPDKVLAIGSTFKLYILAALVEEIASGQRHWDDIVSLGPASLPSGILQSWPPDSPLTLHSLAALMISQSDNSAADTLLALLGRSRVEQLVRTITPSVADRNTPFLSTRELFLLKGGDDPALLTRWRAANEAGRRDILRTLDAQDVGKIDLARFSAGPIAIDSAEWFASPRALARLMDWLRTHADDRAADILAINPGVPTLTARRFAYLGYKGGSEPGVMSMNFLVRTKVGRWFALTGIWNNPDAAVDEAAFSNLMIRALTLLTEK